MRNKLKRIFSYIVPIFIEWRVGTHNKYLEVRMVGGKHVLDSTRVNYSFGGLHKLFEEVFSKLRLDGYTFNNALLLGMGGGSVLSILTKNYQLSCSLTAVEIDEEVIRLGEKYFNTGDYRNLNIVHADALAFVRNSKELFDLIIVDVFIDNKVPESMCSPEFIDGLRLISTPDCLMICNHITDTAVQEKGCRKTVDLLSLHFPNVMSFPLERAGTKNTMIVSGATTGLNPSGYTRKTIARVKKMWV